MMKLGTAPAGSGVGLGIALGVAFGAAFDNVGLGLALGIAFGAALDGAKHLAAGKTDGDEADNDGAG